MWQGVFLLNVPLALIVFYCLRGVTESRDPAAQGSLDWAGAALATVGLAGLTYGFTEGPGRGWSDPLVMVALLGGAAALVAFIFVEARSPAPLVPLGLFRSRTFSGGNLLTFFLYAALGATFFFLPLNLIQAQGYPEAVAGLTFLPFILLVTVLSPWSGALADRIGPRLPLIVGPTIAGFGMAALALPGLTDGPAQYWTHFLPGVVLVGVGMGITVAPLTTSVMKSAPDASAGAASGVNNALSRVGGVLTVAVLGALALVSFGRSLETDTQAMPLSAEARAALRAEVARLGGAAVPPGVEEDTANLVREAIRAAFVDAYRSAMIVSAALAWLSALAAALLIRPPTTEAEERAAPAFVADVNCVQIGDC